MDTRQHEQMLQTIAMLQAHINGLTTTLDNRAREGTSRVLWDGPVRLVEDPKTVEELTRDGWVLLDHASDSHRAFYYMLGQRPPTRDEEIVGLRLELEETKQTLRNFASRESGLCKERDDALSEVEDLTDQLSERVGEVEELRERLEGMERMEAHLGAIREVIGSERFDEIVGEE